LDDYSYWQLNLVLCLRYYFPGWIVSRDVALTQDICGHSHRDQL